MRLSSAGFSSLNFLTFNPEVRGRSDALFADEVPGALAGVVGAVHDAVELAAGPLLDVPEEHRAHRLEVVLGEVGLHEGGVDVEAGVVLGDGDAVLEPEDVADR